MSAISSQLSFPSSGHWSFNPRVFNIMDSIYAIAFGLGLRTLVDAVSQDLKLTSSLIGLWEGVITLHFVKKMPKSSDPYIAYGVRLFIDFLITESIERMVLVLIWTAFGLVLADVTPAIWDEVGLNRVWRHFRRDLYTIYDKIPTVAFFPPQRSVRFLPPRERGREREQEEREEREREPDEISPSITPSPFTPLAALTPLPSEPSETLNHHVPGYFPADYSDLDEGNQSSVILSPSLTHDEIPDMEEVLVDVRIEQVLPVFIPKEMPPIKFPPTPSDSAWDTHRDIVDGVSYTKPPGHDLPNILDLEEDGGASDGWEKIHLPESDENRSPSPPTPPAKDRPVGVGLSVQIPPTIPPVSSPITENHRGSLPPAYSSHQMDHLDDHEDIYYHPPEKPIVAPDDDHATTNENVGNNVNDNTGATSNPWAVLTLPDITAQARGYDEIQAEEAAERKRKEEEENRIRKEEEEERERKEEEERKRREAEEEERKRKEAEQDEKIRKEEEAKRMEEETKRKEEAKLKEEERKRKEEEEALKAQKVEELRREEAEKKRKADEIAERKRKEEYDDALRKIKQAEAAAEQKRKDEEAEKKRKEKEEEDAERKRIDEDAKKKEAEEQEARDISEKQRQYEAATHAQKEAEEAKLKSEAKEAAKTETEQADLDKQNADTSGDQTTEEKEDDSKTVHDVDIFGAQHQQRPSETDSFQYSTTQPHGDFTEEGSEISVATNGPPQDAKVRLERMMILRAQMIEVEKRLDELEGRGLDETSLEMKAAEKSLRKLRRQAQRRYDAAGM